MSRVEAARWLAEDPLERGQERRMKPVEIERIVTADRLEQAFLVRRRVFMDEQGVPAALEFDGRDEGAVHLLARTGGRPVGTLRIRFPERRRAKIERVAVVTEGRGAGVGRALLGAALEHARAAGADEAHLHAQVQAARFYEGFGFAARGEPFMEDGIRHVLMVLPMRDRAKEDAA
jgi:predicted GNAT family N-acyltransferase